MKINVELRRRPLRGLLAASSVAILASTAAVAVAGQAAAATGCRVDYRSSSWPGGFLANVTVANLGDPLDGWQLEWDYADSGQRVTSTWNGEASQVAEHVTVRNAAWNARIATNARAYLGVSGTWTASNPAPSTFTLNGAPCTGTVNPSPTPSESTSPREPHVDNPYAGAVGYVDPQWRALAESVAGGDRVSGNPTGLWIDRVSRIAGEGGVMGLRAHLDAALAQGAGYVQVVLNDLPERDCLRMTPGDFAVGELARYQAEFIDPITAIESDPKYGRLRIVNVVEANALSDLVAYENEVTAECLAVLQNGDYVNGIRYALDKLHPYSNIYLYLSAGGYGQTGWADIESALTDLLVSTVQSTTAGPASIDGIITNVAGYDALTEPYFTIDTMVGGVSVRQSKWVDWKSYVDELPYALQLRQRLISAGFPEGLGVLIDTSRNGWGGPARPTQASAPIDVNTFVDRSRIDRRFRTANWCNQSGAGIGERPVAAPQPGVDGYVWMKVPGISDGTSDPAHQSEPGFSRMCDPNYDASTGGSIKPTGALPGAPPLGTWWPAQFNQLMANAYPPLS